MVIGYAGVFFVNGLSYVAVIVALLLMRPSPIVSSRSGSLFRAIRGGLTHIFHDRFLATLLINFGSLLFFGSTYTILLALFAKTELRTTPVGLGVLYTAIGIGPIVGSLAVASLGDFRCKGRLLMVLSISMSLSEIASSLLHVYWLSLSLLLVAGAAQAVTSAVSITLMQLNTASQYDGPRDEHKHLRYYGNSTTRCIPHWCFERSYRCFCRNSFWRSDSVCDMRLSIRG
jgi:predicted MFS family arabinose efflux permease